jgi:hypothetical protein
MITFGYQVLRQEREEVIAQLLADETLREDILDLVLIQQRQRETSRPFREYLAERKKRAVKG